MADIRMNPAFTDDFERANEIPIQPPWIFSGFSATTASLLSGGFQGGAGDTQYRYEADGPYDFGAGDYEVWGQSGPGCDLTEALRIGFFDTSKNGYMLMIFNGIGTPTWRIRHYTGGSGSFSDISVVEHDFPFGFPNDYALVQVVGGTLNTYYSGDAGANWDGPINSVSVSGSGYYGFLGTSTDDGANPSWKGFGIHPEDEMPQIYRRPNE